MFPEMLIVTWTGVAWGVLSAFVFVFCLLLIGLILLQDSKDTGLSSAFGGGGGGSALLGARMQKDLAKLTAILGIILAIFLFTMSLLTMHESRQSFGSAGGASLPPPLTPEKTTSPSSIPGMFDPGTGSLSLPPATPTPGTGSTPAAPATGASPAPAGAAPATPPGASSGPPPAVPNPAPAVPNPAPAVPNPAPAVPPAPPPAGSP